MTREELEAIKRRAAAFDERLDESVEFLRHIHQDVPALVAEVEKLRALLGNALNYVIRTSYAGHGELEDEISKALEEE